MASRFRVPPSKRRGKGVAILSDDGPMLQDIRQQHALPIALASHTASSCWIPDRIWPTNTTQPCATLPRKLARPCQGWTKARR